MVFLRLTVKIYPREQLQSTSSFSFRSILGDRSSDREDAGRNSSGSTGGKPASFLLVLEKPEEVTLGGLAKMIQVKWTKLRPNAEPLQIKKMLDDDHDSDDLDVDMTAADVFVDRGLGLIDGRDQRGTLRVIQKPTPYSPARFPSVTLDWDAAAEDYERKIHDRKEAAAHSVHKFPTIPEEDSQAGSVSGSQDDDQQQTPTPTSNVASAHQTDNIERRHDMPIMSVEKEDEVPGSPPHWDEQPHVQEQDSQDNNEKTIAATPQHRRFESQELGGSPPPTRFPVPSFEKTAATSQPRASPTRGRAANRTINRIASESESPSPDEEGRAAEKTPPGRRKTRSQSRRISQELKPVQDGDDEEDEEDEEGEDNEQDNEEQEEEEGGAKDKGENEEEEKRDEDGDVAMEEDETAATTSTPATEEQAPEQELTNGDVSELRQTRLGKRKKSQEDLQSNKEPRLDRAGNPTEDVNSTQETTEVRFSSPSAMRKRERAPSFAGTGRRPSITEQYSPPRPGLGMGITKSPPRKLAAKLNFSQSPTKPAKLDFSWDSTKTGEQSLSQPPVIAAPVSSSNARKSLTQDDSTPSKPQTPADKVKSALRKESSADKRRSVSFAEKNSVISAEEPKKAPNDKPPTLGKTVYPGLSEEKVKQMMEEAKREVERKKRDKAEFEQKMNEAEKRNSDPKYLKILSDIRKTHAWIFENEDSARHNIKEKVARARTKLEEKYRELENLGHSKTPEKKKKKKKRASEAAAEKEKNEEPSTPSSNAKDSGSKNKKKKRALEAALEKKEKAEASTSTKDSGSSKKSKASRRENSSKRSTPAKFPAKEPESKQAAPTETTTNGDSAPTTEEADHEADKAPTETPSQSRRKTSPAERSQSKRSTPPSSARRTRRSRRSLQGVDGADAMDIDEPSQPEPETEPQQDKEPEREHESEQEEEQPQEPDTQAEAEPQPQPQPQDKDQDQEEQRGEEDENKEGDEGEQEHELEQDEEKLAEVQPEPESEQPEPEQEPEPEKEPEPEQEQQPEPQQEQANQVQEPQSEQQPEEQPEQQSEQQPEEQSRESPELVPETSQPEQPSQPSPEKPQSQPFRLLSQEQSQSFPMSDDVNLPEMDTIRTVDQSKKAEEPTGEPKPASQEQEKEKESSSEDEDETDSEAGSETGSGSDSGSDFDDEEEQGPEVTKAELLRRANGANGTSSARNSMTKSPAPSSQPQLPQSQPLPQNRYSSPRDSSQPPAQSQPQPHIQPFQSVNGLTRTRASLQGLKNMLTNQKEKHDAHVQQARLASTSSRKKDIFDPPSDSESEDESESSSDSDSDNESSADDGDIQSSGTVGKLRKALQKK